MDIIFGIIMVVSAFSFSKWQREADKEYKEKYNSKTPRIVKTTFLVIGTLLILNGIFGIIV